MVAVFLPSDALSQHLLSYLGFSYLGHGVSLHVCSSKVQPLLLTLDKGYLQQKHTSYDGSHRSVAERNYPLPKVRGGDQECQAASAQEWPKGATPCPRSGVAAEMSYPAPKVRGGGLEEQPHI